MPSPPLPIRIKQAGVIRPLEAPDLALFQTWRAWASRHPGAFVHFDWERIINTVVRFRELAGPYSYEDVATEVYGLFSAMGEEAADNRLEGLMEMAGHSHFDGTPHALVYHLESAPWNNPQPFMPGYTRRYAGVATQLLCQAVLFSREAGYDGAIYLESLPTSRKFYERLTMRNMGPSSGSLTYFQFTAPAARIFLAQHLDRASAPE